MAMCLSVRWKKDRRLQFSPALFSGERISFIKSKQRLIGQYMAQTLDEEWTQARGMEVFAVGMDVSYTEDSQELINMRNKGAMLSDAAVQQGYVAANISSAHSPHGVPHAKRVFPNPAKEQRH